jgi:hypothetical protein
VRWKTAGFALNALGGSVLSVAMTHSGVPWVVAAGSIGVVFWVAISTLWFHEAYTVLDEFNEYVDQTARFHASGVSEQGEPR